MKTKEIENLESYFKTSNEHWNGHTFKMFCEVLKQDNFETPETPLHLFGKAINIFTEQYKTPLRAVQEFADETDKQKLTPAQKLFVYEWVYKYVKITEYDEIDLKEVQNLLKIQIEALYTQKNLDSNKPLTGNIRSALKALMQKELESLPDTLNALDPVQRLNILCKLIPYVLPKVESVTLTHGEPENTTENNDFKW
jgi:hypothetical protein